MPNMIVLRCFTELVRLSMPENVEVRGTPHGKKRTTLTSAPNYTNSSSNKDHRAKHSRQPVVVDMGQVDYRLYGDEPVQQDGVPDPISPKIHNKTIDRKCEIDEQGCQPGRPHRLQEVVRESTAIIGEL